MVPIRYVLGAVAVLLLALACTIAAIDNASVELNVLGMVASIGSAFAVVGVALTTSQHRRERWRHRRGKLLNAVANGALALLTVVFSVTGLARGLSAGGEPHSPGDKAFAAAIDCDWEHGQLCPES